VFLTKTPRHSSECLPYRIISVLHGKFRRLVRVQPVTHICASIERRLAMRKRSVGAGAWAAVALVSVALVCSSTAQAQVKLQYKFPEGQKLTYKTTEKQSQVLKLAGQAFQTEDKKTYVMSWTFGKQREDSAQPIEARIEAFAVESSLPGGITISYDSNGPSSKIANPQLAYLQDVYKLISHLDYTVVLDAQNKVKAVEGTEKIVEKADKLDEMAKRAIRHAVNPQHLKDEFEENHSNLTDGLARPGESWDRTDKLALGNGQAFTFRKRYEYAGTEKRGDATLDKINVKTSEVKYEMDPDSPSPLKVLKSELKIESGDGFILFDREAGRVVVSKGKTQVKGPMTFQSESGGQEIPGELDWTLETDTELQPGAK
jgi:hypothetical protein